MVSACAGTANASRQQTLMALTVPPRFSLLTIIFPAIRSYSVGAFREATDEDAVACCNPEFLFHGGRNAVQRPPRGARRRAHGRRDSADLCRDEPADNEPDAVGHHVLRGVSEQHLPGDRRLPGSAGHQLEIRALATFAPRSNRPWSRK